MTSQPAFNENFFNKINLRQRKANLRLIKSSKNKVITPYDNLNVVIITKYESYSF